MLSVRFFTSICYFMLTSCEIHVWWQYGGDLKVWGDQISLVYWVKSDPNAPSLCDDTTHRGYTTQGSHETLGHSPNILITVGSFQVPQHYKVNPWSHSFPRLLDTSKPHTHVLNCWQKEMGSLQMSPNTTNCRPSRPKNTKCQTSPSVPSHPASWYHVNVRPVACWQSTC